MKKFGPLEQGIADKIAKGYSISDIIDMGYPRQKVIVVSNELERIRKETEPRKNPGEILVPTGGQPK